MKGNSAATRFSRFPTSSKLPQFILRQDHLPPVALCDAQQGRVELFRQRAVLRQAETVVLGIEAKGQHLYLLCEAVVKDGITKDGLVVNESFNLPVIEGFQAAFQVEIGPGVHKIISKETF